MPPVAPDPVPETPRPTTGQPTTGEPTTGEPTTGEPTEEVQSDAASTGEPTGSASDAASTGEPTAGSASDAATGEPTAGSGAAGTDAPTGPPQDDADDGGREAFWYREFYSTESFCHAPFRPSGYSNPFLDFCRREKSQPRS